MIRIKSTTRVNKTKVRVGLFLNIKLTYYILLIDDNV